MVLNLPPITTRDDDSRDESCDVIGKGTTLIQAEVKDMLVLALI